MKILVTGATGLIGSHFVPALLRSGHEVWAMTRRAPTNTAVERLHWVLADLSSAIWPAELPANADAVIHLAQSPYHRDFPQHALNLFDVNVSSTARLLDWSRLTGVRHFILASSGGVGAAGHRSYYIASKGAAELIAGSYNDLFQVLILRFFFVYGPGQKSSMLVPRLVRAIEAGDAVPLAGKDGPRLNPIYVDDAVNALLRAVDASAMGTVDIAGPAVLTVRAMAETIASKLGLAVKYRHDDGAAVHDVIGDISGMRAHLCAPVWTFDAGIASFLRDNGKAAVDAR